MLASEIVRHSVGLVYGGASVGLMGILADAVLGAGGHVTGIIPSFLADKELAHPALTDLEIVGSMHERKARMAELADAFIALPGGFGTFEELCEVLTWAQLGLHRKPCAVLNVAGFFNPLLAMFDHAVTEGFLKARYREMLIDEADAAKLLSRLEACQLPAEPERANIEQT